MAKRKTKKKKKASYLQKLLMITGPLILIQAFVLFNYKKQNTIVDFKDAMNDATSSSDVAPDRQSVVRIHLALNDYKIKYDSFPEDLNELIPDYFDEIPIDPDTAEPFEYTQTNNGESFDLGSQTKTARSKGKDGDSSEDSAVTAVDEEEALLASLNTYEEQLFIYDSTGKIDPFRSFDFNKYNQRQKGKSALQQFDYNEFRVSAVLLDSGEPKAILEDGNGKGHTARVGDEIGLYGGKVHEIKEDRIVVIETTVDFTGEKNTRLIDIFLPVTENDYGSNTREQSLGLK